MNLPKSIPAWAPAILVLALVGFLSWQWTHSRRNLRDALRDAEAARLALSQQIVTEQESKKNLKAERDDLLAQNSLLREAYQETMRAAPGAQVSGTAVLRTAPVRVTPEPEAPGALPPCDRPYAPDGLGNFFCPDITQAQEVKARPQECALVAGDTGSFRVDEILLKTDKGNNILTGTAEFWREHPGPRSKLAAGKFSSGLSGVSSLAAPPEPGWGAELAGLCSRAGCGLGAGVLLPPWRLPLLGWRVESRADLLLGPEVAVQGALGARF